MAFVHRAEPAHPEQVREAAGVVPIGLHGHRRERLARLSGLHQHGIDAEPGEAADQPLGHRARLQAHPLKPALVFAEHLAQGLRAGRHVDLP
jgi:hypothetical protein